jgi:hypothetical protein
VTGRPLPRWPLLLIAAPAAVAVWSGWVGLGSLCGFGVIHPLPGIADGLRLNTAITLPVGVEAYGAYALGAWLAPAGVPAAARTFARRSAIGALVLGMAGQVIYHLLAAAHAVRAPWPVVVLVSCMPVVTLGFGAALTHLLRAENSPGILAGSAPEICQHLADSGPEIRKIPAELVTVPAAVPEAAAVPGDVPEPPAGLNGHGHAAAELFAAGLAAGDVPSIRAIRSGLHIGQDKARQVQAYLETLTPAGRSIRRLRADLRGEPD